MKQAYINPKNIHRATKLILDQVMLILEEYSDYKLTLRQIYYQLVTKLVFENNKSNYAKISTIVKNGRLGGLIDWNAIEDRVRIPQIPSQWNNTYDLLNTAINVTEKIDIMVRYITLKSGLKKILYQIFFYRLQKSIMFS